MRNQILRFGILVLLLTVACNSDEELTGPRSSETQQPDSPSFVISDAAHLGTEGFYFLPPMVPDPGSTGVFDASFLDFTKVRICELGNEGCVEPPLVEFASTTDTDAPGLQIPDGAEYFLANWHTDDFNLATDKLYRIQVQVGDLVIGYADVNPVNTGSELKNVDTGEYIALKDGRTLPIKFRIQDDLAGAEVVGVDGGTLGDKEGGVQLVVPAEALDVGKVLTVQPSSLQGGVPNTTYDFSPDGTVFRTPVELTICYEDSDLPDGANESQLRLAHHIDEFGWLPVSSTIDLAAGCVTGQIFGFSSYTIQHFTVGDEQYPSLIPWAMLNFETPPDDSPGSWDWWPVSDLFAPWGVKMYGRTAVYPSTVVSTYPMYVLDDWGIAPENSPVNHAVTAGLEDGGLIGGTTVFEFDPAPNYVYFEVTERDFAVHEDLGGDLTADEIPVRINVEYVSMLKGTVISTHTSSQGYPFVTRAYRVYLRGLPISKIEIFARKIDNDGQYHGHLFDNLHTMVDYNCGGIGTGLEIVSFINAYRLSNGLAPLIVDDRLIQVARVWGGPGIGPGSVESMYDDNLYSLLGDVGYYRTGDEIGFYARDLVAAFVSDPGLRAQAMRPEYSHVGTWYRDGFRLIIGSADEQLSSQKAVIPGWTACGSS